MFALCGRCLPAQKEIVGFATYTFFPVGNERMHYTFGSGGIAGCEYIMMLKAIYDTNPDALRDVSSCSGSSTGSLAVVYLITQTYAAGSASDHHTAAFNAAKTIAHSDITTTALRIREALYDFTDFIGLSRTCTLAQLAKESSCTFPFYIWTTEVSSGEVSLSAESHPDLSIVDAMYMSCAIPFLVPPIHYRGGIYVDGGISRDIPILHPHATNVVMMCSSDFNPGDNHIINIMSQLTRQLTYAYVHYLGELANTQVFIFRANSLMDTTVHMYAAGLRGYTQGIEFTTPIFVSLLGFLTVHLHLSTSTVAEPTLDGSACVHNHCQCDYEHE